ncbi:MAG: SH3 domain-containing protein [Lachnospiraceae bacterium]|nr:SH3 domain-containing protein [Lachnospiraceae bacterium]
MIPTKKSDSYRFLKRAAGAATIGLVCLALSPLSAFASLGTGVLTADKVNVRADASSTAAKVTQLPVGAEMTVEGVKADAAGKYWYQVTFVKDNNSYSGYILGDYVKYTAAEEKKSSKKKKKKKAESDENVTEIKVPEEIAMAPEADKIPTDDDTENAAETETETKKKVKRQGEVLGDDVRVRKSPVTGAEVTRLTRGTVVTVTSDKKGSDNKTWYKIKVKQDGKTKKGYIREDLLKVTETVTEEKAADTAVVLSDEEFEKAMSDQGFPEDYKPALRVLHEKHPTWTFKAKATGIKWGDVLKAESAVGKNLVAKSAISSWKSTESTAFNWKKNTWYGFDGGSWVAASEGLVAYYLDPRNFLNETQIFQFESLEYQDYQNEDGVKTLLAGTFMKGKYKDTDGKKKAYSKTFMEVGKEVGANPYHLAARCYQEQGVGKSDSISGKVAGYEGIYNYFNVGAYASGGNSPTKQGLVYASSTGNDNTNYGRPWDSIHQSILGGAMYLSQKYILTGQNTLYFQKFNVVNKKNGLYRHQYMTNIQAAYSEAVKMKKAYEKQDAPLVFFIPVYKEMPAEVCALPSSKANPNDYLSELTVEGQKLSPEFSGGVTIYNLTVKKKVSSVIIDATPIDANATVTGTGEVALERGDNVFEIICTSAAGTKRKYTLNIKRK